MHACICVYICMGLCVDKHSGKFHQSYSWVLYLMGCSFSFQFTPITNPQYFIHLYNIFLSLVTVNLNCSVNIQYSCQFMSESSVVYPLCSARMHGQCCVLICKEQHKQDHKTGITTIILKEHCHKKTWKEIE